MSRSFVVSGHLMTEKRTKLGNSSLHVSQFVLLDTNHVWSLKTRKLAVCKGLIQRLGCSDRLSTTLTESLIQNLSSMISMAKLLCPSLNLYWKGSMAQFQPMVKLPLGKRIPCLVQIQRILRSRVSYLAWSRRYLKRLRMHLKTLSSQLRYQ